MNEPAMTLTVSKVRKETVEIWASLSGSMVPREEVVVSVDTPGGRIESLLVDIGSTVTASQPIIQLDDRLIVAQISENHAELLRADAARQQAETQVTLAQVEKEASQRILHRNEVLFSTGSISSEALEIQRSTTQEAEARLSSARAAVAVAEAEYQKPVTQSRQLELDRQRTRIQAPCAGLVIERKAILGAVPQSGEVLMRLAKNGEIEFSAEVPEAIIQHLALDDLVTLSFNGGTSPATVRRIDPALDPVTRMGAIRIHLDNSKGTLIRCGSSAVAHIRYQAEAGLVIPDAAVMRQQNQTVVMVVQPDVSQPGCYRASRRAVVTGLSDGTSIVITSGLSLQDQVVSIAPGFVVDGDIVRIDPAPLVTTLRP